jgi:hypothetical protein
VDFNKILSTLTVAGLIGLVILNPTGSAKLFSTLGGVATSYVSTVQGR